MKNLDGEKRQKQTSFRYRLFLFWVVKEKDTTTTLRSYNRGGVVWGRQKEAVNCLCSFVNSSRYRRKQEEHR